MQRIHQLSGTVLLLFIAIHLFNHGYGILGINKHLEMMQALRLVYRNFWVELILLTAVVIQIWSGVALFRRRTKSSEFSWKRLQIISGLYLSFFLLIHVGVVLMGRYVFHVDTNFYFGAMGLVTFPQQLFFIPYYSLAVFFLFAHLAAFYYHGFSIEIGGISRSNQARIICILGALIAIFLIYSLTNRGHGFAIPMEYQGLIG